jgi:hypothetical protein
MLRLVVHGASRREAAAQLGLKKSDVGQKVKEALSTLREAWKKGRLAAPGDLFPFYEGEPIDADMKWELWGMIEEETDD